MKLDRADADLLFALDLEATWHRRFVFRDGTTHHAGMVHHYKTAFDKVGLLPMSEGDKAAQRIDQSAIREQILVAL